MLSRAMNKTLKTGKSYTMSQLFCGEFSKIIIPDLQRDYCWGGKGLVKDYLRSLLEKGYKKDKAKLPLGLLYGYEEPQGHIQLCDGQQRITTLFLLIGMLNRLCNNEFQKLLISNFELEKDDKKPYLQYAIREDSLYFLSDLVCLFFLKEGSSFKCLIDKECSWYFCDYNNDPSIQSMISALKEIEETLGEYQDLDKRDFAKYITEDLSFMYYDMGNRKAGEETFVIINTSGEPLSPSENLKPQYVTYYPYVSERWEEWEQWFWINRNKEKNDTADNGILEFFRWVVILESNNRSDFEIILENLIKQADENRFDFDLISKITPEIIEEYFKIVQSLFKEILSPNRSWLSPEKINTQIEWFRLLPLISYLKKYSDAEYRNIIRVKQFFFNLAQIDNVSKSVKTLLPQALKIIDQMQDPDIAHIELQNVSKQILTEEEHSKFVIFLNASNRVEIEDLFWKIQNKNEDGKIWNGEIMPLLKWSTVDGVFSYETFKQFYRVFNSIFKSQHDSSNIDITRRALITRELNDYPRYFRGITNKSFGLEDNDWRVLINNNVDEFGLFFKELIECKNIEEAQENMINNFPKEKEWSEFAHVPELIAFCKDKNIQWQSDSKSWVLIERRNANGKHANVDAYKLYLEYNKLESRFWDDSIWDMQFYEYEDTCVTFYNKELDITIDIKYSGEKEFFILNFSKRREETKIEKELRNYSNTFNLTYNGNLYNSEKLSKESVTELVKRMVFSIK